MFVAINQGLIEDLLERYGPIRIDEIGMDVTHENFSLLLSTLVENKFMKVISPKDILFRFSEALEKRLLEKKDFLGYIDVFLDNLKR